MSHSPNHLPRPRLQAVATSCLCLALFLFYKGPFGNALKDWNKNVPALTAQADAQWKKIAQE